MSNVSNYKKELYEGDLVEMRYHGSKMNTSFSHDLRKQVLR